MMVALYKLRGTCLTQVNLCSLILYKPVVTKVMLAPLQLQLTNGVKDHSVGRAHNYSWQTVLKTTV